MLQYLVNIGLPSAYKQVRARTTVFTCSFSPQYSDNAIYEELTTAGIIGRTEEIVFSGTPVAFTYNGRYILCSDGSQYELSHEGIEGISPISLGDRYALRRYILPR